MAFKLEIGSGDGDAEISPVKKRGDSRGVSGVACVRRPTVPVLIGLCRPGNNRKPHVAVQLDQSCC